MIASIHETHQHNLSNLNTFAKKESFKEPRWGAPIIYLAEKILNQIIMIS